MKYIAVFIIFFNSGISLKSEVRFSVAFNQLLTRYIISFRRFEICNTLHFRKESR